MNTNATFTNQDGESITLNVGENLDLQDAYNVVANSGIKATEIKINNPEISTIIPETQEEMQEEIIYGSIKSPSTTSILKKHNLTQDQLVSLLKDGTEHEFEHTTNVEVAMGIAKAHLYEDKDYYIKLKRAKLRQGALLKTAEYYKNGGVLDSPPKNIADFYKSGGETAKVKIVNEGVKFDKKMYRGLLGDLDRDGLANVDDPNPTKKGDKKSVEQLELAKTFKGLLETKENLDTDLNQFVDKLKEEAPKNSVIYGRTKTPFSIINKLIASRMLDERRGLKDLVGTTIAFDKLKDLTRIADLTLAGRFGKVIEFEDFYKNPKDGYKAYHFIIEQNGTPIELQLKTTRMKDVNALSHDAYKKKTLNVPYLTYLTNLVDKADRGDKDAIKEFDEIMKDSQKVEQELSLSNQGFYKNIKNFADGGKIEGSIALKEKYANKKFEF
jgi:ppGpp synthetase/RelA/SpoT-type nucleotidyltranferase